MERGKRAEERADIPLDPVKDIVGRRQRENLSRHALVECDVLPGKLQADFIGNGGFRAILCVSLAPQPQAEKFLVQALGLLSSLETLLVGVGKPVTRGIRRVDLIGQREVSLFIVSHFVLCIDEDEAALCCDLLSMTEEADGGDGNLLPLRGRRESALDDARGIDGLIVHRALCCGGDEGGSEGLIADHAVRERISAKMPAAAAVVVPDRRLRGSRQIPADDDFDGDHPQWLDNGDIGVRYGEDMGRKDVMRSPEPPCTERIQDMALEGDGAPGNIEGRLAVSRNEEPGVGRRLIHVPDLSLPPWAEEREACGVQRRSQKGR